MGVLDGSTRCGRTACSRYQCGLDLIEVVGVVLTPATTAGLLILFEAPDESAPDVVVADLAPRVCKRYPTRLCAQLTRW
ncbi:MAG: hypothetical protein GY698_04860 [Actinomycetia bacterium]|nr:hypothetical protein [Actinomycetes bacterium]